MSAAFPHIAPAAAPKAGEYEFIRQLVYRHSRINLGPDKAELVRNRVQKRLRALGLPDFESYCQVLNSPAGEQEVLALLDVISTNVTSFFREIDHFHYLTQVLLPALDKKLPRNEPVQIWSAACSSGEEPYSLALTLADYFSRKSERPWRVFASDISTRVLDVARKGIYRADKLHLPDPQILHTFFQKGTGQWEGYFRVKDSLREHVTFERLNLFEWPYPWKSKFQVVFCRNVMIYFDRPTQRQLVAHLSSQLEPEGFLFVGHAEGLVGFDHGLKNHRPSVYQLPKASR